MISRWLYHCALSLLFPFWILYWSYFHWKNSIPLQGLLARCGWIKNKPKQAIWIHAASIGELRLSQHIVSSLEKKHPIIISTMTGRGFENQLKQPHFYFPFDHPLCVKLALRCLQPKAIIFIETELWPNLIHYSTCPCFLVNGRLSKKSFENYKKIQPLSQQMMQQLSGIFCVSQTIKERFEALGGNVLGVHPNLKYLAFKPNLPDPIPLSNHTLVCGCTHPKEDLQLIELLPQLQANIPNFKMVIIPRHQSRARWLQKRFSNLNGLIIEDRYGVTLEWYKKARWVFVGGSLIPHGGQNPLEPLSCHRPTMIGPYYFNFTSVVDGLLSNKLITCISNPGDIIDFCKDQMIPINTYQHFKTQQENAYTALLDLAQRI